MLAVREDDNDIVSVKYYRTVLAVRLGLFFCVKRLFIGNLSCLFDVFQEKT
jgi:hypothetical protein